jgi:hypothetical protein
VKVLALKPPPLSSAIYERASPIWYYLAVISDLQAGITWTRRCITRKGAEKWLRAKTNRINHGQPF